MKYKVRYKMCTSLIYSFRMLDCNFVLFLDAHSARCVLGLLSSVGVDGLNRPIRILSPLILGCVNLSLTVGEIHHLLS